MHACVRLHLLNLEAEHFSPQCWIGEKPRNSTGHIWLSPVLIFPSPPLRLLFFPPHWYLTCTLLNLISAVHILVFLTCCVDWLVLHAVCLVWVKYVFGRLWSEWVVLALVKNTERWVSLPRIQIGNFGDLRNAPTWNTHTHTHKRACTHTHTRAHTEKRNASKN